MNIPSLLHAYRQHFRTQESPEILNSQTLKFPFIPPDISAGLRWTHGPQQRGRYPHPDPQKNLAAQRFPPKAPDIEKSAISLADPVRIQLFATKNMRRHVLIAILTASVVSLAEEHAPMIAQRERPEVPDEREVRVLASESGRTKKDFILTEEEFIKNRSSKRDFGKIEWTLPELVKKAEFFINEKLIAQIAPHIDWPPEHYNSGYEYPVGATTLWLSDLEFRYEGDFVFIVMNFYFRGPVGELCSLNVVFYLDGQVARLVDHEADLEIYKVARLQAGDSLTIQIRPTDDQAVQYHYQFFSNRVIITYNDGKMPFKVLGETKLTKEDIVKIDTYLDLIKSGGGQEEGDTSGDEYRFLLNTKRYTGRDAYFHIRELHNTSEPVLTLKDLNDRAKRK